MHAARSRGHASRVSLDAKAAAKAATAGDAVRGRADARVRRAARRLARVHARSEFSETFVRVKSSLAGATGPLVRLTPISTCKIFKVCNDRTARGAGGGLDLARGGLTFGREVLALLGLALLGNVVPNATVAPGGLDLAHPGTEHCLSAECAPSRVSLPA